MNALINMGWKWLLDRAVKSYKSSAVGVAIGAALYEGLNLLHCDQSLVQPAVAAVTISIPMVFGKDEWWKLIWQAVKGSVEEEVKRKLVLEQAEALQAAAAKEAGIGVK